MQKKRLLKLADLLEADAANKKGVRFDLGKVGEAYDYEAEDYKPGLDCGTAACAMGLAAISGAFKRSSGLSFEVSRYSNSISCTIDGIRRDYDDAATIVFDLSLDEADFLFTPCMYGKTPRGAKGERLVAKRIRDFVAGKVRPPED